MFQRTVIFAATIVVLLPGISNAELFPRLRRACERNRCWPAPLSRTRSCGSARTVCDHDQQRLAGAKHAGRRPF